MGGSFRSISQSFLSQNIDLQEFVSKKQFLRQELWFDVVPNFPPRTRQKLVSAITQQYQDLALPSTLDLLKQPNCYTITTGHQLGLNGGPLFVLYKILHTIELAKELSDKDTGKHVVPVFWMATEDHDFQEINHFWVNFSRKITYNEVLTNVPVGDILLQHEHFLPDDLDLLHPTFKQGRELWKNAFRKLLHHYFNSFGLIILDGNDILLKTEIVPYLSDELKNATAFQKIRETNTQLLARSFPVQAFVREINWFYLYGNKRIKIDQFGNSFRAGHIKRWADISKILEEVYENPQNFSPNVLLRPVYQQAILPNLAYVGGWAEISYWLQLRQLFDHWKVNFPVLVPRFSALLYSPTQRENWEKYALSLSDLLSPDSELRKKISMQFYDSKSIKNSFDDFLAHSNELTRGLLEKRLIHPATHESFQAALKKFISNWENKFWKRLYPQHKATFDAVLTLKKEIQPDGFVQERTLNWVELTNHFPRLISQIQPFISRFSGQTIDIELR